MSTIISYTSESADHYLSIYSNSFSIDEIIKDEHKKHGLEFGFLYIQDVASKTIDESILVSELTLAIETARDLHYKQALYKGYN